MARFCTECGGQLDDGARFCGSCGASVAVAEAPPPPRSGGLFADPPPPDPAGAPPPPGPTSASGGDGGDLRQFTDQLRTQVKAPGVLIALAGGVGGWLGALVIGAIMAGVTRDLWLLGILGIEADVVVEAARIALQSVLVRAKFFGGDSETFGVLAWTVFPLAGAFLGARILGRRSGLAPAARAGWGVLAAAVFLVLSIPLVIVAGTEDYAIDAGSLFLYSILLVGGTAAAGAWTSRERSAEAATGVRATAATAAALLGAILRPLAVAAVILWLVGLLVFSGLMITNTVARLGWDVEALQEEDLTDDAEDLDLRLPNALGQAIVVSPNLGLQLVSQGMLAEAGDTQIPATDAKWDELDEDERQDRVAALFDDDELEPARIFDADEELPVWVFLPLLIIVLLVANGAAAYAGFIAARRVHAPTALLGAAWGALVGIVWALVLVIVDGMLAGDVDGASLFASVLLFGTLFGAAGGLLAVQGRTAPAAPAAAPPA